MMNQNELQPRLTELCDTARELISGRRYEECRSLLCSAMEEHPDNAEPHNLLGLLLEKQGDHSGAMRHFRAANALDPAYRPAQQNLDCFGVFPHRGGGVYSPEEETQRPCTCVIVCDARGIRHCVRASSLSRS